MTSAKWWRRCAERARPCPTTSSARGPTDLDDEAPQAGTDVRLSELFSTGKDALIVVYLMYAPEDESACPMCTMWADGYNGIAQHLLDRVSLAVVARAEIGKFRRWGRGRGRGWRNLRLLSSLDNTFNADFAVESDGGKSQFPAIIVFVRGEDGGIRHHYTGGAIMGPDQFRGLDLYSPVWHLFDLLPSGREDWFPKHAYG